jgi:hypothetical protein
MYEAIDEVIDERIDNVKLVSRITPTKVKVFPKRDRVAWSWFMWKEAKYKAETSCWYQQNESLFNERWYGVKGNYLSHTRRLV